MTMVTMLFAVLVGIFVGALTVDAVEAAGDDAFDRWIAVTIGTTVSAIVAATPIIFIQESII